MMLTRGAVQMTKDSGRTGTPPMASDSNSETMIPNEETLGGKSFNQATAQYYGAKRGLVMDKKRKSS